MNHAMSRIASSIVAVTLVVVGMVTVAPSANATIIREDYAALESSVLTLINNQRTAAGSYLPALKPNAQLRDLTREYTIASAQRDPNNFPHTWNAATELARMNCYNVTPYELTTVQNSSATAQDIVNAFLSSNDHQSALVSNKVHESAIYIGQTSTNRLFVAIRLISSCNTMEPIIVHSPNRTGSPSVYTVTSNVRVFGKQLTSATFDLIDPQGNATRLTSNAIGSGLPKSPSYKDTTGNYERYVPISVPNAKNGTYKLRVNGNSLTSTKVFNIYDNNNPTVASLEAQGATTDANTGRALSASVTNGTNREIVLQSSVDGTTWKNEKTISINDPRYSGTITANNPSALNMKYRVVAKTSEYGPENESAAINVAYTPANATLNVPSTATTSVGANVRIKYSLTGYTPDQQGTISAYVNGSNVSTQVGVSSSGYLEIPANAVNLGNQYVSLEFTSPVHNTTQANMVLHVVPLPTVLSAPASSTMDVWDLKSIEPNSSSPKLGGDFEYYLGDTLLGTVPAGSDTTSILKNANLLNGTYAIRAEFSGVPGVSAAATLTYNITVRPAVTSAKMNIDSNSWLPFASGTEKLSYSYNSNNTVIPHNVKIETKADGEDWVTLVNGNVNGSGSGEVVATLPMTSRSVQIRITNEGKVNTYTVNRRENLVISGYSQYRDVTYGSNADFVVSANVGNVVSATNFTFEISQAGRVLKRHTGNVANGRVSFSMRTDDLEPGNYSTLLRVESAGSTVTSTGSLLVEMGGYSYSLSSPGSVVYGNYYNVQVNLVNLPDASKFSPVLQHNVGGQWTNLGNPTSRNSQSLSWSLKGNYIGNRYYRVVFNSGALKGEVVGPKVVTGVKNNRLISSSWATSKSVTLGSSYSGSVKVTAGKWSLQRLDPGAKKYVTVKSGTAQENATVSVSMKAAKAGKTKFRLVLSGTSVSNARTLTSTVTARAKSSIKVAKTSAKVTAKKSTKIKVKLSSAGQLQQYKSGKWKKVKSLKKGSQNVSFTAGSKKSVIKYRVVIKKSTTVLGATSKTVSITAK